MTTETETVEQLNFPRIVIDEYPVDYDEGSMNLYLREGDDTACLAITDHSRNYGDDEETDTDDVAGIDMRLDEDELTELALACIRTLGALGGRSARNALAQICAEAATEMV